MNLPSNSSKKLHETQSEQFRTRLLARMCIALVCLVQLASRLAVLNGIFNESTPSGRVVLYALPCAPLKSSSSLDEKIKKEPWAKLETLLKKKNVDLKKRHTTIKVFTVATEYYFFKKKGPQVLKYSKIVDLIILSFFAADWVSGLVSSLMRTQGADPVLFSVSAMYGFTAFAWRALLVTLIVQTWHLKIIVPIIVTVVGTIYAIHFDPEHYYTYIIRMIGHLFNIIIILYCEDKIKWRMILTNLQQEKWVQVNNFILNNIPENIMIMDVKGETKFISDHCRALMHQCLASLDSKDFLNKIRDLERCDLDSQVSDVAGFITEIDIDRLMTGNGLLTQANEGRRNSLKVETLADLILTFPSIVSENRLKERQFLIYNGKFKTENQNRSIEVKISFFQHYENEYIILILRDTTQRDLLVTLQETNKYKDQLLASVSHELRAPLNGNINLVEGAVNSPAIPENIKETLLTPALRSSKFLLHMINDILDMSQINEKKLRLVFHSGDLKETVISAAQLVEFQAKKKGIDLVLELDPSITGQFCTDHMRLSQILLNLLSNAIKFTNEGMVKLKAIQTSQSVEISVEDTGIGMSEDNIKKLFTNYTHIEFAGRQTMNPAGVGLGLNIAYRLVQLLAPVTHQALNVESVLNYGSRFSFQIENKEKLPANFEEPECLDDSNILLKIAEETPGLIKPLLFSKLKTNSRTPELENEPFLESSCSCPQILIVDDNPFNIMAFETILGSLKIKCESVYSGPASIKKLLDCDHKKCGKKDCKLYSVIFMDQEMPEMTGAETVKEIKRLQKEKVVPQNMRIIGCTAHKAKEEVDKFLEAGLDSCIHKPISTTMIRDIL